MLLHPAVVYPLPFALFCQLVTFVLLRPLAPRCLELPPHLCQHAVHAHAPQQSDNDSCAAFTMACAARVTAAIRDATPVRLDYCQEDMDNLRVLITTALWNNLPMPATLQP